MKRWFALTTIIMTLVCLLSSLLVSHRGNSGIKDISTTAEFQKYIEDFSVESMYFEDEQTTEMLLQKQKYFDSTTKPSMLSHDNNVNIFIVEVKTDFQCYIGTYNQKAIVKQVVQGDSSLKNKEISIIVTTGIAQMQDKTVFLGALGKNIMFPNNKYLVFCEKLEIYKYLEEPYFRTINYVFSYLNLDSDYSCVVENLNDKDTYFDYKDSEFFVNSKETLDTIIEIKHYIIENLLYKT